MRDYNYIIPHLIVIPLAAGKRGIVGLGSGIITMTTFSLLGINLKRVSVVLNIIFLINSFVPMKLIQLREQLNVMSNVETRPLFLIQVFQA